MWEKVIEKKIRCKEWEIDKKYRVNRKIKIKRIRKKWKKTWKERDKDQKRNIEKMKTVVRFVTRSKEKKSK